MTDTATKEVANYDEMLAKLAKSATAQEKPLSSSIGCRAGVLSYNGTPVPGNKLDAIIIASTHSNLYYEGAYDANNLSNPVCFAYSDNGDSMTPHPASSKPQHENCTDCPQNQWGSAGGTSKGKACKNSRSLALIPADTKLDEIATAEIAVLKLPVMSVRGWSQYVSKLDALFSRPPLGMITQIGTTPDQKSQFKVTFLNVAAVDNSFLMPLIDKAGKSTELLEKVYDANSEKSEQAPAKPAKF